VKEKENVTALTVTTYYWSLLHTAQNVESPRYSITDLAITEGAKKK